MSLEYSDAERTFGRNEYDRQSRTCTLMQVMCNLNVLSISFDSALATIHANHLYLALIHALPVCPCIFDSSQICWGGVPFGSTLLYRKMQSSESNEIVVYDLFSRTRDITATDAGRFAFFPRSLTAMFYQVRRVQETAVKEPHKRIVPGQLFYPDIKLQNISSIVSQLNTLSPT